LNDARSSQDSEALAVIRDRVTRAHAQREPLELTGGGTKAFYGRPTAGETLSLTGHRGVVEYEPSELALTARAGTPLEEIESLLADNHQMLAFEPPHFGAAATLGGAVACGLSGPRRPYAGAVRDHVLGVRIVNGKGESLAFGGRVMKNVAGYDLSRLMAGALGTLGILTEVSLKVLPLPQHEHTLALTVPLETALEHCRAWALTPLPVSATAWHEGRLTLRLSGAEAAVRQARQRIGGETVENGDAWWTSLREQTLAFFTTDEPLWRLSLPPDTPPLALPGDWLYEWGGALRWLKGPGETEPVRRAAAAAGGHATLFRNGDREQAFQPLDAAVLQLHQRLKLALDPAGIFNPGRLYPDL
jgi:glycolate oxidase FAD binding subunit